MQQRLLSTLWLPLVVASIAALIDYIEISDPIAKMVYDRAQNFSTAKVPDDIVIIAIDEKSILELGRWPWPRKKHAELVDKLSEAKVKAIVFDVLFTDVDSLNPSSDQRFAEALASSKRTLLPMHIAQINHLGQNLELLPAPQFFEKSAGVGHVHIELDTDGVCRSVFLREGLGEAYWPHMSVVLAELLSPKKITVLPGTRRENNRSLPHTNIVRNYHNLIPFHFPANSFNTLSYIDILNGGIPSSFLDGKIVLVGATATGMLGDEFLTPVGSVSGVELNAYIFHALRSDSFISEASGPWRALSSGLITLLFAVLISTIGSKSVLFTTVVGSSTIVALSIITLIFHRFWYPPISIAIGIISFYPLLSWRRLQTALVFLSRELELLMSKDQGRENASSLQSVTLGVECLTQILPIASWNIYRQYKSHRVLILSGGAEASPAESPENINVQDRLLTVTLLFSENESNYSIDIKWEDIFGKKYTAIVEQLVTEKVDTISSPGWGASLVEQTIHELSQARVQADGNNQLIHQTLSKLNEGVIVTDICGRVMFCNQQAEKQLGDIDPDKHDIISLLTPITVNSGVSWPELIKHILVTGEAFSHETVLELNSTSAQIGANSIDRKKTYKGDSEPQSVDLICRGSLLLIDGEDPDTIIFTLSDISNFKKIERDRRETLDFLSHDLQAPLISVLSILGRERLRENGKKTTNLLDNIERHIRKNLSYAENFLQVNRAENIDETMYSPCDMYTVVDSAIAQTISLATEKNIDINVQRSTEDVWVMGNGDLLERAITNLLTNAIKNSTLNSTITTRIDLEDQHVHVSVIDHGKGIVDEDINSLFDKFTRGKNQGKRGSGLGLYFTKLVAQKHQGWVLVSSKPNRGATFIFSIPAFNDDM